MSDVTIANQIEMLRVQLETALPLPIFLVVSSARDDDGKELVSTELARALRTAGYSTLLVVVGDAIRDIEGAHEPASLDEVVQSGIDAFLRRSRDALPTMVLSSDKIRHTASRDGVARFADMCRKRYQITIVDVPTPLTNSFSLLAAVAADGVLLTVREGRRVSSKDRELANVLVREQALLLGVVSVTGSIIRKTDALLTQQRADAVRSGRATIGNLDIGREGRAV